MSTEREADQIGAATAAGPSERWQSAADVALTSPRNKSRFAAADVPLLLALALAMMCWGGIMLLDQFGPTFSRDARVTDVHINTSGKGSEYSIEGVDSAGGEFTTGVPQSVSQDASIGDVIVVHRAVLTGRAVGFDGPDWQHEPGALAAVFAIPVALGIPVFVLGMVLLRRRRSANPEGPSALRLLGWPLLAVLVAAALWIGYERTEANAGSAPAPAAAVVVNAGVTR